MAEADRRPPPAASASLTSIPGLRQLLLLLGLAAAVAAGVAIALWSQGPSYRVLYPGLDPAEVGSVSSVLETAGITYQVDGSSGALLVDAAKANQAQLLLAGQGLPRSRGVTLENLYDGQGYATSQFMETKFYTHALESKLERVIGSLNTVKSAQVSLGLPKQSVFLRDRKDPTASVVVHLYPGRDLEPGQARAIVHLVASSVPGLAAGNVTLLDGNGSLLSANGGEDELGVANSQFEYRRRLEQSLADNIDGLLVPIMGPGRSRTRVVAQLDFTDMEETTERFDPASQVVRSEQTSQQESTGGIGALGVPGALTNQPPVNALGNRTPPAAAGQAGAAAAQTPAPELPRSSARDATTNYEVDRTISRKRAPKGQIERLSVAVVLDYLPAQGGKGDAVALTPEQLAEIGGLIREAVGYDSERGDTLNLINMPFQTPPPAEEAAPPPLWEQAWVLDAGKIGLGALVILALVIWVLRPLVQGLMQPSPAPLAALPNLEQGAYAHGQLMPREDPLQIAHNIASNDPKRIAQVVKDWVAADE
ncbi:MAG: flagellar basal-body MS-ring/collar protein FliF [Pseudomonadales bacterium]